MSNIFTDNKDFYPTPRNLISDMVFKVKGRPKRVLEPSAGKGDIVEYIRDTHSHNWRKNADIATIEKDPHLQAVLRSKGIKVLDSDFLTYSGPDKFDLIILNPPFDDGDKHLAKAIDILYRGEIVCLLNAETIRNPFNNHRKALVRKLEELGAEIEFRRDAFISAERQTDVEIALVYIKIDRKIEDDLFAGADDHATGAYQSVKDKNEVATGKTIADLVAEYNQIIHFGTDTIVAFYRNYHKVGQYFSLHCNTREDKRYASYSSEDLTTMMQDQLNEFLSMVRTNFWRKTLNLEEVRKRLTRKKEAEFEEGLKQYSQMEFTESNIRQFVLNLIGSYEQTLTEAVIDIFDMFTVRHTYHGGQFEKNIHYYSGWKRNSAFKVRDKVIIPGGQYERSFRGYFGDRWALDHDCARLLDDIDKVMNYFDGMAEYVSMSQTLRIAFAQDEKADTMSGIESTYFIMTAHKKGTIHLTFKDKNVLRRFNVVACRGKGWLPGDFGAKNYNVLSAEEKAIVDSFEGEKSYSKHVNKPLFRASTTMLQLDMLQPGEEEQQGSEAHQEEQLQGAGQQPLFDFYPYQEAA